MLQNVFHMIYEIDPRLKIIRLQAALGKCISRILDRSQTREEHFIPTTQPSVLQPTSKLHPKLYRRTYKKTWKKLESGRLKIRWSSATVKTKCMLVTGKRLESKFSDNCSLHLKLNGTEIKQVNSQKLLGVTIDNKLSFDDHIERLCKKLTQKIASP